MTFGSRQEAGRKLGQYLTERGVTPGIVLGLPRGGVVVAAEVAHQLHSPLDVLVVRKIGHPLFREFAVGALAEDGVVVLDESVLQRSRVDRENLGDVIEEETHRLEGYQNRFARSDRPTREGQVIIIVDDGLATGATLEAAVRCARQQDASRIVVAVPVASTSGAARIARVCDQFYALWTDPTFEAVGQYYDLFRQTTDEEVMELLERARTPQKPSAPAAGPDACGSRHPPFRWQGGCQPE
jgi:putative phosphoribosyl transferase